MKREGKVFEQIVKALLLEKSAKRAKWILLSCACEREIFLDRSMPKSGNIDNYIEVEVSGKKRKLKTIITKKVKWFKLI